MTVSVALQVSFRSDLGLAFAGGLQRHSVHMRQGAGGGGVGSGSLCLARSCFAFSTIICAWFSERASLTTTDVIQQQQGILSEGKRVSDVSPCRHLAAWP